MLLMPLLTMWHEIGGHAAVCALQGSKVQTIGAFYIHCATASRIQTLLVAFAGVTANTLLALVAYLLWKKATGDRSRLVLWLIWLSQGFTAVGYLCFSGASGAGDLGVGSHGAIGPVSHALAWRLLELVVGVLTYTMLVKKGARDLTTMLGDAPETRKTRQRIAYVYYGVSGMTAVLVGLLNPLGIFITLMSAAASSWGGLAGLIGIGRGKAKGSIIKPFVVETDWFVCIAGLITLLVFAAMLGPSIRLR
jgi:hypothetical protein